MKLIRFGARNEEKPGLVTADGRIKERSALVRDFDHAFFFQRRTRCGAEAGRECRLALRLADGSCDKPSSHDTSRIAWAKLMARAGEEFPLECPRCGGDILDIQRSQPCLRFDVLFA